MPGRQACSSETETLAGAGEVELRVGELCGVPALDIVTLDDVVASARHGPAQLGPDETTW